MHFLTEVHGKWLLAGEHAALRGGPVLVFPLACKTLALNYTADVGFSPNITSFAALERSLPQSISEKMGGIQLKLLGDFPSQGANLFWQTLRYGLKKLGRSLQEVKGLFELTNHIPMGAGLGASAALCVVMTRWFIYKQWLNPEQSFLFARNLEDLFHGKSSGVDILGVTHTQGLFFQPKTLSWEKLDLAWTPAWYLSFSGRVGSTADCVHQVSQLHKENPELALSLDQKMVDSVTLAKQALIQTRDSGGLDQLALAMTQAYDCFKQWGLVQEEVSNHIAFLLKQGALAAKPTGSGRGGYVLSLWPKFSQDPAFLSHSLLAFP